MATVEADLSVCISHQQVIAPEPLDSYVLSVSFRRGYILHYTHHCSRDRKLKEALPYLEYFHIRKRLDWTSLRRPSLTNDQSKTLKLLSM